MKLIKINTDHYVVVDDSEIREGDFVLHPNGTIGTIKIALAIAMVEGTNEGSYVEDCKKITHSTQPLNKSLFFTDRVWGCERLSLGKVKELIGEVDVEKKAVNSWEGCDGCDTNDELFFTNGYQRGYNQAIEDNKEKKYTEEDISKALSWGYHTAKDEEKGIRSSGYGTRFFQSIQPKTEWEVEIVDGKLKLKL